MSAITIRSAVELTERVRTQVRPATMSVAIAFGQALFIAASLYLLLGGWHRDVRVPLKFSSDSLWFLMQSKSTVDNGWWWWNSRLGAPFSLDELAYPSNSNVDQAIVWVVSRFVPHAIAAVNIAWGLIVVLSGLAATWCLRKLGVSAINALVAGTLFALSPYALYRNIDHFSLVIYLVPFACLAALWLSEGRPLEQWPRTAMVVVLAGLALLSFDYVYYAFFGFFCIGVGTLLGYFAHRNRQIVASGAICLAVIAGATLLNLAPSFVSWSRHGQPIVMKEKMPAESEMFGLKIRQLISPVYPHPFPPFRQWVEREAAARFPNENENWTARLGLVGTLGFLGLLALLFAPAGAESRAPVPIGSASRLTLAAVLFATVGGFGSLFSLFVSPDIRAYDRIFPFIAFFSLLTVALAADALFKTRRARTIAALVILTVGLVDQGQAAHSLNARYDSIAADVSGLGAFVDTLERALPNDAMVFQLPFRAYMSESQVDRMKEYDHFRPYLLSHTLRFSYPALSNDQVRWQQAATRLDVGGLVSLLSTTGFSAILIDRYGYQDDADALIAALVRVVGQDRLIARTDRYVALSLGGFAGTGAAAEAPAAGQGRLVPATLSMTACAGQQPQMIIDQIGAARAPFDAKGVHVSPSSEVKVTGWALDPSHKSTAGGLDIVVDRTPFASMYGLSRDDVAKYFQHPEYRDSGFVASIPREALTKGEHTLRVRVVSSDGKCYRESPGLSLIVD
jgi:phosphoglycerol transferase